MKKRRKKKPWISKEVLKFSDRRKEMRKTKTNSDEDRERYREITKEIKRKARKCKETWIEEKCQEAEKAKGIVNTGKLFQTAEEICGTISTKIAMVKTKEGRILDNKEVIKQRWNQHYEELYNNWNPVDRTVLEELPVCNEHEKKHDLRPSPHNFLLPLRDDTNYILRTLFRWLRPNP